MGGNNDNKKESPAVMITFLEQKKQCLFQIIQEVYNLSIKVSDDVSRIQFLARAQSIDKTRSDYVDTIDKLMIEKIKENPDVQPSYSILNTFDELYCFIKQTETTLRQELEEQKKNDNYNTKLPPLNLIGFDGTPSKWPIFYENFRSVIHINTRLTNADKVQYLIGCLSGRALNVCSGITATSENYDIIWQALLAKYHDTRVQASGYLDQMLQQKPGQSADNMLDNFCSAEAALQRLKIDNLSDFMITHIALSKLEKPMLDLFEQAHRHVNIPQFCDLKKFLSEQSKLQVLHTPSHSQNNNNTRTQFTKSAPQINKTKTFCTQVNTALQPQTFYKSDRYDTSSQSRPCKVCNSRQNHPLFKCEYFLNQNTQTRNDIVRQHTFCINCLGFHHISSCKSTNKCSICSRKHHSLLHFDNVYSNAPQFPRSADNTDNSNSNRAPHSAALRSANDSAPPHPPHSHSAAQRPPVVSTARTHGESAPRAHTSDNNFALSVTVPARTSNCDTTVLLPTATVNVDSNNKQSQMRLFLDTGSMSNFVTKSCCERLKLKVTPAPSIVKGIGQVENHSLGITQFKINSRFDSRCTYTVCARVIDTITDFLPNAEVDRTELVHLQHLPMADDHYYSPARLAYDGRDTLSRRDTARSRFRNFSVALSVFSILVSPNGTSREPAQARELCRGRHSECRHLSEK
jgi:hypothetical protein